MIAYTTTPVGAELVMVTRLVELLCIELVILCTRTLDDPDGRVN